MHKHGFTLIELLIVLVIIALIVGGVLVGKDLIAAAETRAQISQIEKYQAATNTFRAKYGYLPGDIPEPAASGSNGRNGFGFVQRGTTQGQGDGNGILQNALASGNMAKWGEVVVFWNDLGKANLIDGTYVGSPNVANTTTLTSTPSIYDMVPTAKIGNGNFVYVWSGTPPVLPAGNHGTDQPGNNYFGISALNMLGCCYANGSEPAMTVNQAYNIDQKIDDGLPQTGKVMAIYQTQGNGYAGPWWAQMGVCGGSSVHVWGATGCFPPNTAETTPGAATTCFDRRGNAAGVAQYSTQFNGGAGANCAQSFQFQ